MAIETDRTRRTVEFTGEVEGFSGFSRGRDSVYIVSSVYAIERMMIYKCPRFDERVVDWGRVWGIRGEKGHQSIRQSAKAH